MAGSSFSGEVGRQNQLGGSLDGKENKTSNAGPPQRTNRWRAPVAVKERGKLFTPSKYIPARTNSIRQLGSLSEEIGEKGTTSTFAAGVAADFQKDLSKLLAQQITERNSLQQHRSLEIDTSSTSKSAVYAAADIGAKEPTKAAEMPFKGGSLVPKVAVDASRAAKIAADQLSTPRGKIPAAAALPSTVSKLWSKLKSGAKLGFAKPAESVTLPEPGMASLFSASWFVCSFQASQPSCSLLDGSYL